MYKKTPVYYSDYLQLDKILSAQHPESEKYGQPAHDEMLFIIVHQAYELWFKQILFELDSIIELMRQSPLPSIQLQTILSRLERINLIWEVGIKQISVLETMTPLDFLDFRDHLVPASGFQSLQFRLFETKIGVKSDDRLKVEKQYFNSRLSPDDLAKMEQAQSLPSLFEILDQWLSRLPFDQKNDFDFWKEYEQQIHQILYHEKNLIEENATLTSEQKIYELKNLKSIEENFRAIFDESDFQQKKKEGFFRFSFKAFRSALFISLYRDWPMFQLPFRILMQIIQLDENLTTWRYRHAMLAQRMIGQRIGTGGSSGYDYLKKTAEHHRIFIDLYNLSTFMLPKSKIPQLPPSIQNQIDFMFYQKEQ